MLDGEMNLRIYNIAGHRVVTHHATHYLECNAPQWVPLAGRYVYVDGMTINGLKPVPSYTTDATLSLLLMQPGWSLHCLGAAWSVTWSIEGGGKMSASANTAALAICKAYLAENGVPIDEL